MLPSRFDSKTMRPAGAGSAESVRSAQSLGANASAPGYMKPVPLRTYMRSTPTVSPGARQKSCAVSSEQSGCRISNVTSEPTTCPAPTMSSVPSPGGFVPSVLVSA